MRRYIALTTAAACMSFSIPAAAETYSAAASWVETHGITVNKLRNYAEYVSEDTDGNIEFEVFSGGSLAPAASMASALRDEVAMYGHITSAYMPADLPLDNVLNDLVFIADDPMAAAFASTEVKLNSDALQQEYADYNLVFGTGYSMTTYYLICNTPISSVEDLEGKRIRTGSSSQIKWAEHVNAISVSVPATEIYTGLERGTIDCSTGDASFLTSSFQLQDVAKHTTLVSLGTHNSGGEFFNGDFWQARTPEERRILLDNLARAEAELQVDWARQAETALEEAKSNGVELIEPSEDLKQSMEEFTEQFLENLPETSMEERGVSDPSELIDAYIEAEARWKDLLSDVDRTDSEALTELLINEIYADIDVETYGVN
ncbi:C4-dicarboxylate TRAP transporter substrate-binding protein [Fodinicurvata halophila]|uniref:C4-dicarboxylate TRAP transporter substrate-binding protein n=1 Tax=Fodinicurvata halophila TaxID=1419723 RepID=A0ABV8UQ55_9PROT